MVHRDRNHPSVFIWSIGNEVMDQRDVEMTKHLADIIRKEDPTRPVSNGYNDPDGGREVKRSSCPRHYGRKLFLRTGNLNGMPTRDMPTNPHWAAKHRRVFRRAANISSEKNIKTGR